MGRYARLTLLVALIAPVLTSCASVSKAPSEHSEAAKAFEAPAGRGVVYLYRKGRAVGAALSTQIKINGQDAGGTGPGTFFRWELRPGAYTFLASTSESSATVELQVEAGKLYFIEQREKLGLQQGRVSLNIEDGQTGSSAVSGLSLLVSAYIPD